MGNPNATGKQSPQYLKLLKEEGNREKLRRVGTAGTFISCRALDWILGIYLFCLPGSLTGTEPQSVQDCFVYICVGLYPARARDWAQWDFI